MHFDPTLNRVYGLVIKKAVIAALVLLTLIVLCPGRGFAQLDPSFGTGGVAASDVVGSPLESFVLPGGKLLVVSTDDSTETPDPAFSRFNSDGSTDLTYGTNGTLRLAIPFLGGVGRIRRVVRQPDGKFLLSGIESDSGVITRFNEDGTIDPTFASGGIIHTSIGQDRDDLQNIILLPDGKILVVGAAYALAGGWDVVFLRYSANGVPDATFGGGSGFVTYHDPGSVSSVTSRAWLQSDQKVVFVGVNPGATRIQRFNADGSLDNSYPLIIINTWFNKSFMQPDDKLLVAGADVKTDLTERAQKDIVIRRYTASGTLDATFGTGGNTTVDLISSFDDSPRAIQVMADGQILIGAQTWIPFNRTSETGYYVCLGRLSADGRTITGKFRQFYSVYRISSDTVDNLLTLQPDGKIISIYQNRVGTVNHLLLSRAVGVPLEKYRFHGTPFDFQYDPQPFSPQPGGSATADSTVYRPSDQKWYIFSQALIGYPTFGAPGDIPVAADYLGGFGAEFAVFRPSTGVWYIARNLVTPASNIYVAQWGTNGDIPTPADFDGDGKSDIAIFRPSTGAWWIRNGSDLSSRTVLWGTNGDKPVAGDYDGDGIADIAVWRPSNGVWYVLRSSDGQASYMTFGTAGDVPVQEDFDGDGKTDIAVWRPSNGVWYIARSSDGGFTYTTWGLSGDVPVPTDYDGDAKTDIAVWRPSEGRWYIVKSSDNGFLTQWWGLSTDIPVQGRY